jgi:hypothetical protein
MIEPREPSFSDPSVPSSGSPLEDDAALSFEVAAQRVRASWEELEPPVEEQDDVPPFGAADVSFLTPAPVPRPVATVMAPAPADRTAALPALGAHAPLEEELASALNKRARRTWYAAAGGLAALVLVLVFATRDPADASQVTSYASPTPAPVSAPVPAPVAAPQPQVPSAAEPPASAARAESAAGTEAPERARPTPSDARASARRQGGAEIARAAQREAREQSEQSRRKRASRAAVAPRSKPAPRATPAASRPVAAPVKARKGTGFVSVNPY